MFRPQITITREEWATRIKNRCDNLDVDGVLKDLEAVERKIWEVHKYAGSYTLWKLHGYGNALIKTLYGFWRVSGIKPKQGEWWLDSARKMSSK